MKKFITYISILVSASAAYAFSLGGIAKSVADSTGSHPELVAQQDKALAKYKESKVHFSKSCSIALECANNPSLATQAKETSVKVSADKTNYTDAAKLTDAIVTKTLETPNLKVENPTTETKTKYEEALASMSDAIKAETEAGKELVNVSLKAKDIIAKGSNLERAQLGASFGPSIELAQSIPSDVSKMKQVGTKFVDIADASGIPIPDSVKKAFK